MKTYFKFCFVYLHDDQEVMPMDDISDIRGCSAFTDIPVSDETYQTIRKS